MATEITTPFDWAPYPVAKYANGRTWRLDKGDDYKITEKTYLRYFREWAKDNNYELKFKIEDGGHLVVKMTKRVEAPISIAG